MCVRGECSRQEARAHTFMPSTEDPSPPTSLSFPQLPAHLVPGNHLFQWEGVRHRPHVVRAVEHDGNAPKHHAGHVPVCMHAGRKGGGEGNQSCMREEEFEGECTCACVCVCLCVCVCVCVCAYPNHSNSSSKGDLDSPPPSSASLHPHQCPRRARPWASSKSPSRA
jgi:hypothetical protein